LDGKSATLLRLEGFEKSVKLRVEKLQAILSAFGEQSVLNDKQTVRASDEQRKSIEVFQPENAAVTAISKRIREQFDPMGKFYTGRMG